MKIVAADTDWKVCDAIAKDRRLAAAVAVIGAHYPVTGPGVGDGRPRPPMPASCYALKKPLWTSEGWNLREVNDYQGAMNLGATINLNWILEKQTAMIVWTAIFAWYSILPYGGDGSGFGHGLMTAVEPWSGHYSLRAPLYMLAHTAQFVHPGCKYVDSASVMDGGVLSVTGSAEPAATAVAFVCDDDGTFTLVMETSEASLPIHATLNLKVSPALQHNSSDQAIHVWETCNGSWFKQKDNLTTTQLEPNVDTGRRRISALEIVLQPRCIYTLSTSTGQRPVHAASIPPSAPFPVPYFDNFDHYVDQGTVRYFTDQAGSWNAAPAPASSRNVSGMVLQQVVEEIPNGWSKNSDPHTIAGDDSWTNFAISARGLIGSTSSLTERLPGQPTPTYLKVCGRVGSYGEWHWPGAAPARGAPPNGYCLIVDVEGAYYISIREVQNVIASGKLARRPELGEVIDLRIEFSGNTILASVNGTNLPAVHDDTFSHGMVALGSGWNRASFDDVLISNAPPILPRAKSDDISASSSARSPLG